MRLALRKLQEAATRGANEAAAAREKAAHFHHRMEVAQYAAKATRDLERSKQELDAAAGSHSMRDRFGMTLNRTPMKVNEIVQKWDDSGDGDCDCPIRPSSGTQCYHGASKPLQTCAC